MPKEQVKPIYVLHGDDEHLRDAARRDIVASAVGQGDPQLCVSQFDSDAELAVVLDELRTLPFLAPHRVVIVSQADAFISAHREALEKYLETPSATGTLVLMTLVWQKNTRLFKTVQKVGQAIDCSVPENKNLPEWVSKEVTLRGKKIAPEAAEMLAQWIGRDLAALTSEIDKLFLYATDRPVITASDVTAIVTATAGPEAFELTNRITAADAAGALKALGGMLARRGDEFKALGMIGWHLRRALQAQQAIQGGANEWSALKMPTEHKKPFLEMLRRRGTGRLLGDFRRMLKADLAMKSGADPQAAMQELVVALCR